MLRLTGRKAALVGVSAAAATATLVAVAGTALAAPIQQTSCTDTVRVRNAPSPTAPVIGTCAAGEKVSVDETRNGFAHLTNKKGWASLEFVNVRGGSVPGSSTSPSKSKSNDSKPGEDNLDSNDGELNEDGTDNNNSDKKDDGGGLGGLLGGGGGL